MSQRAAVPLLRAVVSFFRRRLSGVGTPERARTEKAYLKSELRFYGASVPEIRRAAADFAREHPQLDHADLRAIAEDAMRAMSTSCVRRPSR